MDIIWSIMMLLSTAVLLIINPGHTITTMLDASKGGLSLCLDMCAIYAVWLGMMEILDKSGLNAKISKILRPLITKLFKTEDKQAIESISINLSANILGLGNAATPAGIKAMQCLDDKSGKATFPMIMLLVVNATSIQLIPTTAIGLRANLNSISPADIILPTFLTTIFTTVLGIVSVICCSKLFKRRAK